MSRQPAEYMEAIAPGAMEEDIKSRRDLDRMNPEHNGFLGVARVTNVNYEEFYVHLKVEVGSSEDFERVPIPLTHPGAGRRHFLGSMPEVGDYCIVGWMAQESSEGRWGTKTPVILGWVIPGTWPGRSWLTTMGFPVEEFDFQTVKEREMVRGTFDRIRHKLRHMQPGNVLASSGQGADLVLDESATLSNRRGNELRLRDSDQALVVRSLQQFHAWAGGRTYQGMVQRDARLLQPTMFSDGLLYDGRLQSVGQEPLTQAELPLSQEPEGFLTPARILARQSKGRGDGLLGRTGMQVPDNLDPYSFLQLGGFLDAGGYSLDETSQVDAYYGGKPFFRVASQGAENATLHPDTPTLTEFRVELAHTSDGRLPVTEQTDGFDAERLPRTDGDTNDPQGISSNSSYLEFILGSVVGNDPYTPYGRARYGMPLVATVFDGAIPAPRIDPARIISDKTSGLSPTPLGDQLATLFRMSPRVDRGAPDTFVGYTKKGQLRAAISGPVTESSADIYLQGGLHFGLGGQFDFNLTNGAKLATKVGDAVNNIGWDISSERGAVRISGGGSIKGPAAVGERLAGTGRGEGGLPSVDIQAGTNGQFVAQKRLLLKGEDLEVRARTTTIKGLQEVRIQAADRVSIDTKELSMNVVGKMSTNFAGPKDFLPTNGALEEKTYATFPGFNAKRTLIAFGDRSEEIFLGNDFQAIRIGNFVYSVNLGTISLTSGTSNLTLTPGTLTGVAVGAIAFESTGGTAVLSGTLQASLIAKAGPALVRGSAGVILSAPADFNQGPIITAGSLDPLTGLPFITWGMGAKLHLVTT